jgi:catechol 2,3-dioxygenase-like lactoylglutathione lyase family enzyme
LGEYALSDVPKLSGLLETALYVSDLEESRQFYQRIFGFECLLEDHRMCALQVPGSGVLLLFKHGGSLQPSQVPGGVIPAHGGSGVLHLCFAIPGAAGVWRDQPVFSRSGRAFGGSGDAGVVGELLRPSSRIDGAPAVSAVTYCVNWLDRSWTSSTRTLSSGRVTIFVPFKFTLVRAMLRIRRS